MPKQFSKYLGYFCNKFVAKNFQKSPNLVTLKSQTMRDNLYRAMNNSDQINRMEHHLRIQERNTY